VAERIAVLRCSAPAVVKPAGTFWDDITIEGAAPAARFVLRGGSEVAQAAGSVLHMDMALAACRSVQREEVAALWLGPDEWLLLAPPEQEKNLADRLRAALASLPHALVDVGHRDAGFLVRGRAAVVAINAGCPLDLRFVAFPVGACTRTLLGKAEIVLWRREDEFFQIETARSFATYVRDFLELAARDAGKLY
jgi:sarcosine oxidase subunit gamma